MTWEQKFEALKAISPRLALTTRKQGDWYITSKSHERREGGCLSSGCEINCPTPETAVDAHWEWATSPSHYLVLNAYGENRRAVRWNGFMWEDVNEDVAEASV